MAMISVPIVIESVDGLPEVTGRLDIFDVVADMLADGVLRMQPVFMQYADNKRRLMEIKLVPAHEAPAPSSRS